MRLLHPPAPGEEHDEKEAKTLEARAWAWSTGEPEWDSPRRPPLASETLRVLIG